MTMPRTSLALAAAATAAFVAAPAMAQFETAPRYEGTTATTGQFGPDAGSWELTLGGSGSNDQDFDTGSFNLNADLSHYFSRNLSAGVRQSVWYSDFGGTDWNASTAIFGQFHFGDGALRPFVGLGLGYLYGDSVQSTFFAGPEAGLRYYVKPETFIYGRMTYEFLFEDSDDISDQFDEGRFVYTVGIGFNF